MGAAGACRDFLENVLDTDVLVVRSGKDRAEEGQPHEKVADELVIPDEASAKGTTQHFQKTDDGNGGEHERHGDGEDGAKNILDAVWQGAEKRHQHLFLKSVRPVRLDRLDELGAVVLVELFV